ncbi:MAG: hypothetical protein AABZ06_09525 [Bdellovibrionota bacterium]
MKKINNLAKNGSNSFQLLTALMLLAAVMAAMTGCGKGGGLVSNATVRSYVVENDTYAEFRATLNTGNIMLVGIDVPIIDPRNPSRVYGHMALVNGFGKGSDLVLTLNVTETATTGTLCQPMLPNGTPIPVGGIGNATIICMPVGNTGARAYFGVGEGVALAGVAMSFKNVDLNFPLPINVFFPFSIDKGRGVAGFYTGDGRGTSGLALFMDLSGVLNQDSQPGQGSSTLELGAAQPKSSEVKAVYRKLNSMHKAKTRLYLE